MRLNQEAKTENRSSKLILSKLCKYLAKWGQKI